MPSGPDGKSASVYTALDHLPADARALFGEGLFLSASWFNTAVQTATPRGEAAEFVVVNLATGPAALFPMWRHGRARHALTTPYTCLWRPLLAPDLDAAQQRQIGRVFGRFAARHATMRLDAIDLADPAWPKLIAGMRDAGLAVLPFDHFGNWTIVLAPQADWAAYLASRPGQLRETVRRRGKQLLAAGATLRILHTQTELADALAAYDFVYAASWKPPEPYPKFNAALMRDCARAGTLRLGLLQLGGDVLAAQFWVVQGHWAGVLKLAHNEHRKSASPGTVLTGMMIRHLIEVDGVTELDFGRGDDAYKQDWTDTRHQRHGLLLANPRRPGGLAAILRRRLRDWWRPSISVFPPSAAG